MPGSQTFEDRASLRKREVKAFLKECQSIDQVSSTADMDFLAAKVTRMPKGSVNSPLVTSVKATHIQTPEADVQDTTLHAPVSMMNSTPKTQKFVVSRQVIDSVRIEELMPQISLAKKGFCFKS